MLNQISLISAMALLVLWPLKMAKAVEMRAEMGASILNLNEMDIENATSMCEEEPHLVQCDVLRLRVFEEKRQARIDAKNAEKAAKKIRKELKRKSHDYKLLTANYQ